MLDGHGVSFGMMGGKMGQQEVGVIVQSADWLTAKDSDFLGGNSSKTRQVGGNRRKLAKSSQHNG
jgi:hypothetical protein